MNCPHCGYETDDHKRCSICNKDIEPTVQAESVQCPKSGEKMEIIQPIEEEKPDVRTRTRVCIERVTFVAASSLVIGTAVSLFGDTGDLSWFWVVCIVAALIVGFYTTADVVFQIKLPWKEKIPIDEEIPFFDWKRCIFELIFFAIIFVICMIGALVMVIWQALQSGANH